MKRVIDRFLIGRRKLTDILHRFPFLSTVAFASSSPRDLTISSQTNKLQANPGKQLLATNQGPNRLCFQTMRLT